MDRFKEMATLVAVVDAGSFVQAAERLRSSKAAVSRIVADLEGRLGARLLNRTTRRLSLTEAGQAYVERCRQILDEVDEADGLAGMSTSRAVGLLRVNAPYTFGVVHLAPLWGPFMQMHPDVTLDISLSDRVVDLVEEGFDLAVRISDMPDSSLVTRRLAGSAVVMCAAPDYLHEHGHPRTLEDLAHHHIIAYSYWRQGDTWSFDSPQGRQAVLTRPRLRANNGDICRAAALAGQGIVLQPTFLVGEDIQQGRLVRVLPELVAPELGVYAVYPSRKHLSAKVRALVDFLSDAFRDCAGWQI
mgnify:FL=1